MAAILQFLHNLYTLSVVVLTLFFLEIIILFRSASRALCGSSTITATQYFKLIERKNPASRYKAAGLKDQNCKECSVCLSEFKEEEEIRKVRQCNHTFHKNCLDMWLQQDSPTCPLCRISVLPEEIVTKYMQQRNNQDYYGSDERMLVLLSALHGNYLRILAHMQQRNNQDYYGSERFHIIR